MSNSISKLWFEFLHNGKCGLCGNSGYIDTTNAEHHSRGIKAYCICPNGRVYKQRLGHLKKWEGTSILEEKDE